MKRGLLGLAVALCGALTNGAQTVELISRAFNTSTTSAHGSSLGGSYSPDSNFILFSSTASDLVNVPNTGQFDLYLLNTTNNSIQLVSAGLNGEPGSGASTGGAMSSDNRFAVFQSSATNLVAGDTNNASDIFVRDLTLGTTTLVSHNLDGAGPGNEVSEFAQISSDGEWVVFQSNASNLATNDINKSRDLFAWKRSDQSIRLISAGFNGNSMADDVTDFSLSPDGQFVLFTATGTNLVVPKRSSAGDVYLYDMQGGTTRWISSVITNLPGLSLVSVGSASMSTDSRFVFMVATPPTTSLSTLVRVDLNDNSVIVVATNLPAPSGFSEAFGPSISDDGQFAAYTRKTNIFYWSAATGLEQQVDVTVSLPQDGTSDTPILSHDGKKVAFLSTSSDLVAGIAGGNAQIYGRDMVSGQTSLVSHSPAGAGTTGNEIASLAFNFDGSALLFDSGSNELLANDNNDDYDVFVWTAATGGISFVSASRAPSPSLTGPGFSTLGQGSISADGRFVAFSSLAALTANDTNNAYDAYVFDRATKTNILVSAGPDGFSMGFGAAGLPKISGDGMKVAFESRTPGLDSPDDVRAGISIYLRDLGTGTLTNISGTATGDLTLQQISADGRYVFFTSRTEVHRYDTVQKQDLLEATSALGYPALNASADGTRLAYQESSSLYFRDFAGGERILVDAGFGVGVSARPMLSADGSLLVYFKGNSIITTNIGFPATNSFGPILPVTKASMSADGQIIAFQVHPTNVGSVSEVWFLDRTTGQTNLVSRALGKTTAGNGDSGAPVVSADGRFIAFESWASDLVANDDNTQKDVFVYDRLRDRISLVSHAAGSENSGNSGSFNPVFAPAGAMVGFISGDSDLVAGDLNESIDVFAAQLDVSLPGDSDGDGLDDAWELAAFSTLDYGPNDDPDGDGSSNLQEFRAGTLPNDAASGFVLHFDGSMALSFKTAPGHTYQLEARQDFSTGSSWQPVGVQIGGDGSINSIQSSNTDAQQYFRIRLIQ